MSWERYDDHIPPDVLYINGTLEIRGVQGMNDH